MALTAIVYWTERRGGRPRIGCRVDPVAVLCLASDEVTLEPPIGVLLAAIACAFLRKSMRKKAERKRRQEEASGILETEE